MSDFKLDIDYPYEIIRQENLYTRPEKVPYKLQPIRYRHYGKFIEQMIRKATEIEDVAQRRQLVALLANHMKRAYLNTNKEGEIEDEKIFKDLAEYSSGTLMLDVQSLKLRNSKEIMQRKNKNMIRRAVR